MEKADLINMLRGGNTVFSFKDILLASGDADAPRLRRRLHYYVKSKQLYSLRRGIYAKDKNYDRFELANKIYSPAYISFETVLAKEGVVFQHYDRIFAASYLTREISCDGRIYAFRRLKDAVLVDSSGVEIKANYSIATRERAFLDTLYLNPNYHFDNLASIDWTKCREILPIYGNQALAKRLDFAFKQAQHA